MTTMEDKLYQGRCQEPDAQNNCPLRVRQEVYVDCVIEAAIICNSGAPHLGAFPGPLFSDSHHFAQPLKAGIGLNEGKKWGNKQTK